MARNDDARSELNRSDWMLRLVIRPLYSGVIAFAISQVVGCHGSEPQEPDSNVNKIEPAQHTDADQPESDTGELPRALLPHEMTLDQTPRPARTNDWFEDMTEDSGLNFSYRDGSEDGHYTLIESLGGGAALFDFDQDSDLDIFLTGGGTLKGEPIEIGGMPCALFRNDGNWKFTDVSAEVGVGDVGFYTHGSAVGDFNRDGWPDLVVAGYQGIRLFENDAGQRFKDVTERSNLKTDVWNTTCLWLDYDNDGWLDLYVLTYCEWEPDASRQCLTPNQDERDVCGPSLFPGQRDQLWRNRRDGTFEDVTSKAGFASRSKGLGVIAADFDEDGAIDIYVAIDVDNNQIYRGQPELPFLNLGLASGIACSSDGESQGSMGIDFGDFDGNGRVDLWYANFADEDNQLFRNLGDWIFVDAAAESGIVGRSRSWVGFGTAMEDFDNDGWLDLAIANGHVAYSSQVGSFHQPAQLLRNIEGDRFDDVSELGGPYFSVPHAGRGLAVGDLDNDGATDMVVVHQDEPVTLLRNRNSHTNWVRVQPKGTTSNPDAVGAKVTATIAGRRIYRWVRGGGGYLSHFDRRILFPTEGRTSIDVSVKWPTGSEENFRSLNIGQTHILVEGTGESAD